MRMLVMCDDFTAAGQTLACIAPYSSAEKNEMLIAELPLRLVDTIHCHAQSFQ